MADGPPSTMANAGLVALTTPNALGGAALSKEGRIELAIAEGLRALEEAGRLDGDQLHAEAVVELKRALGHMGSTVNLLASAQIGVLCGNATPLEAELAETAQRVGREMDRQERRQVLLNTYLA